MEVGDVVTKSKNRLFNYVGFGIVVFTWLLCLVRVVFSFESMVELPTTLDYITLCSCLLLMLLHSLTPLFFWVLSKNIKQLRRVKRIYLYSKEKYNTDGPKGIKNLEVIKLLNLFFNLLVSFLILIVFAFFCGFLFSDFQNYTFIYFMFFGILCLVGCLYGSIKTNNKLSNILIINKTWYDDLVSSLYKTDKDFIVKEFNLLTINDEVK